LSPAEKVAYIKDQFLDHTINREGKNYVELYVWIVSYSKRFMLEEVNVPENDVQHVIT